MLVEERFYQFSTDLPPPMKLKSHSSTESLSSLSSIKRNIASTFLNLTSRNTDGNVTGIKRNISSTFLNLTSRNTDGIVTGIKRNISSTFLNLTAKNTDGIGNDKVNEAHLPDIPSYCNAVPDCIIPSSTESSIVKVDPNPIGRNLVYDYKQQEWYFIYTGKVPMTDTSKWQYSYMYNVYGEDARPTVRTNYNCLINRRTSRANPRETDKLGRKPVKPLKPFKLKGLSGNLRNYNNGINKGVGSVKIPLVNGNQTENDYKCSGMQKGEKSVKTLPIILNESEVENNKFNIYNGIDKDENDVKLTAGNETKTDNNNEVKLLKESPIKPVTVTNRNNSLKCQPVSYGINLADITNVKLRRISKNINIFK